MSKNRAGNYRSVAKLEAAAARHDREQKQRNFASHFLHARMMQMGITQSELARRATQLLEPKGLKITRSSISKYLEADGPSSKPNPVRLQAIARVLDVAPEQIVPPAQHANRFVPVEFKITSDGKAWLTINQAFSQSAALRILKIAEEDSSSSGSNGHGSY